MNIIKRNIPNTITCLNLLSGVVAIIFASKGDAVIMGISAFCWAYIFIAVAAVADFLDGFAARALGAYSDMGKELDSLCDMVSFGVAPAFILYQTLTVHQAPEWVAWLTPLVAIGGALRLARFQHRHLPLPQLHRPSYTRQRHLLDRLHRLVCRYGDRIPPMYQHLPSLRYHT